MFAYLILNIQTIFKVVLGTFGYLVVFLFFFTSARDVEHKGHCWFIFIFSTKIKFNDFIECFFQINLNAFMISLQDIHKFSCITRLWNLWYFFLYFSWIVHSYFNNRKYLWLDKEYRIFFPICLQKVSVKIFFCIFLAQFDEILMHTLNSSKKYSCRYKSEGCLNREWRFNSEKETMVLYFLIL